MILRAAAPNNDYPDHTGSIVCWAGIGNLI